MIQTSHRFHSSSDMAVAQQFGDKAHGTKAFVKLSLVSFMYLLTAPLHFSLWLQKSESVGTWRNTLFYFKIHYLFKCHYPYLFMDNHRAMTTTLTGNHFFLGMHFTYFDTGF